MFQSEENVQENKTGPHPDCRENLRRFSEIIEKSWFPLVEHRIYAKNKDGFASYRIVYIEEKQGKEPLYVMFCFGKKNVFDCSIPICFHQPTTDFKLELVETLDKLLSCR
jgi:hypothetical protein